MVGKRGDYNVQRLLGNRKISGRIQTLTAAGDLAPDLSDSLFNLVPVHYLIDHGANIDVEGINKKSPLQVAAADGKLDIVKLHVEAGADINRKNPHYNQTAIELAVIQVHRRIEKYLRKKLND